MEQAGATEAIARFISATPPEMIPAAALHEAKRTLINVLAVGLSASLDPSALALAEWDGGAAGGHLASALGGGRLGIERAALLNGYLAHLQDYERHPLPVDHPSERTDLARRTGGR